MSKIRKLFNVNLQLFGDGGAVGAEGSGEVTESAPKADVKPHGSSRRSKSGEFDNVIFGQQESAPTNDVTGLDTEGNPTGAGNTDVTTTSNTLEERRKAYHDLINEYKDIDQERFQQVFDRRFKEVKGIEAKLLAQKPIMDLLKSRYGEEDVAKLEKAINEDTDFWESIAEESGMTVEQYKAVQKLERENAEFRAMQERQKGEMQFQNQLNEWNQQAQKVKELYPSFDLQTEAKNPDFISLLKSGVGVEHAYELIHMDEIKNDAARAAAHAADAQAQARIKSKASRPSENGTSSQSAAIVKNDVASLTRAERAEIARRVQRGDTITF